MIFKWVLFDDFHSMLLQDLIFKPQIFEIYKNNSMKVFEKRSDIIGKILSLKMKEK